MEQNNNSQEPITRRQLRNLEEKQNQHRSALEAFTLLTGIGENHPNLIEHFENSYLGTFKSRTELVNHQLEALGWTDTVNKLIAEQAIPEGFLTWNEPAIYTMIATHLYDVVEHNGALHIFMK